MSETITLPEDLRTEVATIADSAKQITITTPAGATAAADFLQDIKGRAKRIVEFFKPLKASAVATHKAILAKEQEALAPFAEAEDFIKSELLHYQQVERRKAEEEQRRLQAKADAEAAKRREHEEREAAKQRAIEEAARIKAQEARRLAEEADAAERRKLLAQADAAERKAQAAAAKVEERVEAAQAIAAPVVHVPTAAPKISGLATRQAWTYEIVDESLIPRDYLIPNERTIGAIARAMKEKASIPGIRFYATESVASASR